MHYTAFSNLKVKPQNRLFILERVESLIQQAIHLGGRHQVIAKVENKGTVWPVHSIEFGPKTGDVPAVAFVGGVHGLERIGTEVVLAHLESIMNLMEWDDETGNMLSKVRVLFVPLLNPTGMLMDTRANAAGVDLMRNSPVQAIERITPFVGGQRLSSRLPWFRGKRNKAMEPEVRGLVRLIEERLLLQPFSLVMDCHSGYGQSDHLWFPYAFSKRPIEHLAEVIKFKELFFKAYPNHRFFSVSPQSMHYITHGDLWDYLYLVSLDAGPGVFIPFTLEMGSWAWIKKNPRSLFNVDGLFNPQKRHRHHRVLRRHLILLQFTLKAAASYQNWLPEESQRLDLEKQGMLKWFKEDS